MKQFATTDQLRTNVERLMSYRILLYQHWQPTGDACNKSKQTIASRIVEYFISEDFKLVEDRILKELGICQE